MPLSDGAHDQVGQLAEQILYTVRGGMTPEDAAARLSTLLPASLVEQALQKYREASRRVWTMKEPGSIYNKHLDPWYLGPDPSDRLWHSYEKHLNDKEWDPEAIKDIDDASTRVVSLLDPPGKAQIRTRGLVLGHVQSGKTASFTAVIAKAADVGYRFIIVLSGMNNVLRYQTQLRIDEDLIAANLEHWITVTNVEDDFASNTNVNSFLTEKHSTKVLGVVKKNSARLQRLHKWLTGARPEVLRACPILIIDDEADQASPNSHPKPDERTKINELIVQLLADLPKAAYVGYTATPFANLFIDPSLPEDLYPRDFIVDLPRGKGYFGTEQLFGRAPLDETDDPVDGLNVIRLVPEYEATQLKPPSRDDRFTFAPAITPTLREAILYFWMATAARRVRGQRSKHASMLIHTTQYAAVHRNSKGVIDAFQNTVLLQIQKGDTALAGELEALWLREQAELPSQELDLEPVAFEDLMANMAAVVKQTETKVENGSSPTLDRVDYQKDADGNGRIYIVVGGNVLSRGLTLEGLTVSFFTRSASAYDTLLQMGRWFGYRPGYGDLARVWMTEELRDYFYDLASVEREIRQDISRYKNGDVTPMEFAVRIRQHPALAITAKLKMQHAVPAKMAFNAREVQTIVFRHEDQDWLDQNLKATRDLVARIREIGIQPVTLTDKPHKTFLNVPSAQVLQFLGEYTIDISNSEMPAALLQSYIREQNQRGHITFWTVAIVTRSEPRPELGTIDLGLDAEIPLVNRARSLRERNPQVVDIKALMSETDVAIDVPRQAADLRGKDRSALRNLRDEAAPDKGLLLLYPISKDSVPRKGSSQRAPLKAVQHIMGLALVFPDVPQSDLTPQNYMTVELPDVGSEMIDIDDLEDMAETAE
ncbi:Z1 domain-containing protein [Pseudomonas aeruginosa]|uniref:Z1 domain-containing protein n=1 Tax=Pseudomonas aeruginosa TaxID=287 RepID=UPI0004F2DEEB|nr:Z1 domain-containing protein [Pseudomonas aeruginosa]EKQ6315675.1 Z1 domain-containing protein [Pseudomonas aeruginosa]ELK4919317.1 Z1 domain-containing protein [Pseudomonas aeruginosa]ELM3771201.1 Z1 domain-containing protein [Pseudomonas aeruginosa]ELP2762728.1 Z1 domain-containing protein [Pseudomonas aeruginosa]MBG5593185.1 Z1 domain-containing protein [Pseudomonas aeruginosa]